MRKTNWKKVNEVLEEVLAIESSERQDYFKNAEIDKDILEEVESLLAFEEAAESSMNLSAVELSKNFLDGEKENPLIGQEIGEYKIERELGYGGMGAVYLASRTDGKFKQRVALKLLKREMNTSALRRRFQMEREILASLEHPNIARLLNAGATSDKIPYIAMEYVEGLPIDDYCNKHNLDLDQRLNLFRKVCSAVDFAHRNLIVHRDLKPSNILVTEDGTPKLLDFGISKILSTNLGKINTATVTKMGVMTPSYASPEQLKSESVTTATDIYSLGVILYEILSGHRPFEGKEDDIKEIYSAVLESEPPLPSALVDTASKKFKEITEAKTKIERKEKSKPSDLTRGLDEKTEANKMRQTKPLKSNIKSNLLKGDLDNIILKALKKEPERRYSSAENFAEDIKRHQEGNPVNARPDTFSYRASKFVRRNRFAVGAGALVLIAIFGGVIATLWQARQAQAEAAKAQKINEFLQNVLNFSNPHWLSSNPKRNKEAKIEDALNEALKTVDKELAGEPEVQAEIYLTIGKTFIGQGKYLESAELLEKAISLFDQVNGSQNTKSMQAKVMLGDMYYVQSKLDKAEKNYNESIDYFRSSLNGHKDNPKYLAIALNDLANVLERTNRLERAEKLFFESMELAKNFKGKNRFIIPIITGNLGKVEKSRGNYDEAINYYKQAESELISQGNEKTDNMGWVVTSIGDIYLYNNENREAEKYFIKSFDILKNAVGDKNIYTLRTRISLAQSYLALGKYEECERLIYETQEILDEMFPDGHQLTAYTQISLGRLLTTKEQFDKGENELRQALTYFQKNLKEPNEDIAYTKYYLAENLAAQNRTIEARKLFHSTLDSYVEIKGKDDPMSKKTRDKIAVLPNNSSQSVADNVQ